MSDDLMQNYNSALGDLYEHCGFEERWVVLPLDDCTCFFWQVDRNESQWCKYGDISKRFDYEDMIYTQRHYEKWVFRGNIYTMVMCDSQVDGNKFLRVFLNEKEVRK